MAYKKIASNPFFVCSISFGIVLSLYSLGWSDLFPSLTFPLYIFLAFYFSTNLICGLLFLNYCPSGEIISVRKNHLKFIFFFFGWFLIFFFNRGFPLITLINNPTEIPEVKFIPSFYIIVYSYTCFYSIWLFYRYRITYKKIYLLVFFLTLLAPLLMISRISLVTTLFACVLIYIQTLKRLEKKSIFFSLILIAASLYGFGLIGNLRSIIFKDGGLAKETKATESFQSGPIPTEFYWTYIYGASPLANFQSVIEKSDLKTDNYDFKNFATYYLLPDFIYKRIEKQTDIKKPYPENKFIIDFLNVCTMYTNSYVNLGWLGPYMVVIIYTAFLIIYIFTLNRKSEFFVVGLASISSIYFFGVFDNILVFSAISFQLFYPIAFGLLERLKYDNKNLANHNKNV